MSHSTNIIASLIGIVLFLIGIIFEYDSKVSTAFTGVGASVFATGLVNMLLNWNAPSIELLNTVQEALADHVKILRTNQELELIFTQNDGEITIEKTHKFCLENRSLFSHYRTISMFSDCLTCNSRSQDGFIRIVEPDHNRLENDALESFIKRRNGKEYFTKKYRLPKGKCHSFEFKSRNRMRTRDRLIWTVQDFSESFKVKIINSTKIHERFIVKINHHREQDDSASLDVTSTVDKSEVIAFEISSFILPYQGFEIMWDFSK